jgi:hypothetical protein
MKMKHPGDHSAHLHGTKGLFQLALMIIVVLVGEQIYLSEMLNSKCTRESFQDDTDFKFRTPPSTSLAGTH